LLSTRILTAVIAMPLFLGILYYGGIALWLLVSLLGSIGFWEFGRMWRAKGVEIDLAVGISACLALFAWAHFIPPGHRFSAPVLGTLVTLTILLTLVRQVARFRDRSVTDALIGLAGIFYVGWLLSHILLIRALESGLWWLAVAFFCTWAADTGAYFAGRAFGRRKLAPQVSPGKTWEGFAGGSLLAVITGALLAPYGTGIGPVWGAGLGLLISLVSVAGDLAESSLKRHCGVKDSGAILPGHGGVLDRFDSSLFVLPVVYYIAYWLYM
jgi:phosphatidate cytidylyltransferase